MATSQMNQAIQHLRRVVTLRDGGGLSDGQLLADYVGRRDQAALAALVRRHGPMVWGVCCRVLRNRHDAEDAFQATFLVLVRKAASLASPELLANWLHGVAHQTALKARATTAKRKTREKQVTQMPEPAANEQEVWDDLLPLLDQEVSRLPDKHRIAIVLCDLEGKTRKEAAQQLGCPEGTVAGRLARARATLAKRLIQRGVTLSGAALVAMLAQQAASARVPDSVVNATLQAAAGAISGKVAALTEGVLKAMLLTKLKTAALVVLFLGFVATTGATLLGSRPPARQDHGKPAAEHPLHVAAKQDEDTLVIAWGNEVGGLQAGLSLRPGDRRAYRVGDTITLVVRVRNVSKQTVKFEYVRQWLNENPPTVTMADGKTVRQDGLSMLGIHVGVPVTLEPGKEIELEPRLAVQYGIGPALGTGKVSFQYQQVFGESSSSLIKIDPALKKLATGKLELEIKEAAKGDDKAVKEELKRLEGTWRVVAVELGGKEIDRAEFAGGNNLLIFSGSKCSIVVGKTIIECTFTIDPTKNPRRIDLTRSSDKITWPGIYDLKGDSLKLFQGTPGGKPPTEFKSKEGTQQVIHTHERVKPPQGLEFLTPIPEFHEFRFGQDELALREIAKRHALILQGPDPNGGFLVWRTDGETLALSMRDGKCSGIQRLGKRK